MKTVVQCFLFIACSIAPALAQHSLLPFVNRLYTSPDMARPIYVAGSLATSSTLWVDPAGDDATAEIGRPEKPFASPETASAVAPPGSTIFLRPGGYNIYSNSVIAPAGGRITGYGATITNWLAPTWRPAFRVTDDSIIEGIHVVMARSGSNVFQVAVGTGVIPPAGATTPGPTNFVIRNVTCLNGDSDVFFFFGTNTWGSLYNVHAKARWDTIAYNNIKQLKVYNSVFEAIGPNSKAGNEDASHSIAAGSFFQNTRAEFYNCVFKAQNTNSYNIYSTGAPGNGAYTNQFFFYNCTLENDGAQSLATNVYQDGFVSTEITFLGTDVASSNLPPGISYAFLPRTNLVQNISLDVTAYARGGTVTNGSLITTPVVKVKKVTRDIIQVIASATGNSFSPGARLVLVTPLPGGISRIFVRDGQANVDVSDFFSYRQFSNDVEGSQMNALSGMEKETDYGLIELSLRDSGVHLLELQFNVSGLSTEKTSSIVKSGAIVGKARRTIANLAGTGTFRDNSGEYSSIIQATWRITGDTLEIEEP
jgi:hypothetical protein